MELSTNQAKLRYKGLQRKWRAEARLIDAYLSNFTVSLNLWMVSRRNRHVGAHTEDLSRKARGRLEQEPCAG